MIDQPITNRFTGKVQFTAQIDADPSTPLGLRIGLAVRWAVKSGADLRQTNLGRAYLRGASLGGADFRGSDLSWADLGGADLRGSDLSWADLGGAWLRRSSLIGADLRQADLSGTDLSGADLSGAYLYGDKIARIFARVQREIDPYTFMGVELAVGGFKIAAGCNWFTLADFRAHVAAKYPDTEKATETLAVLDFIESRAKALGIKEQQS